jgi:hypothetical protein
MTQTPQANNSEALLSYLIGLAGTGQKNWFGYQQQRLAGTDLAYRIAAQHANTMTPKQIVQFVIELNDEIYEKILKG